MEKTKRVQFAADFEPVDADAWRATVERDLKGASFDKRLVSQTDDGIRVEPLYTQADAVPAVDMGYPGAPPFARGARSRTTAWAVCEKVDSPDPEQVAAQTRTALERGADGIWIQLDENARAGRDWDHVEDLPARAAGGVMLSRLGQLEQYLEHADLTRQSISLDAGAHGLAAGAMLLALCRKREVDLGRLRGSLNADPLGALARDGHLTFELLRALELAADLAGWLSANAPNVRAMTVSTLPYHDAGATAAQELGAALATGATYLRTLTGAGLSVEQAGAQILFRVSVGRDVFFEIAKLRALRLCWARVLEACGAAPEARSATLHACTSWRTKTRYDPWVNLLRATVELFSAAVGGAEMITTSAFDEVIGPSDDFARRLSRNTQTVLQQEAYVARVADPAGGSWYVESLTRKLADAAWNQLQQIEQEGGMIASLAEGKLQSRIEQASAKRQQLVDKRRLPITGVSEFPNVFEQLPERRAPDVTGVRQRAQQQLQEHLQRCDQSQLTAALTDLVARGTSTVGSLTSAAIDSFSDGATIGRVVAALVGDQPAVTRLSSVLRRRRDAESFERLRSASDAYADVRGARPKVFLANMGPIPQHRARAEFSSNLFQAGGFEPISNDGFDSVDAVARAFAQSKAQAAVICSTDEDYRERAAELAGALKERGASLVLLAGRPGEQEQAYREAGVDHFIFLGCDVHGTLATLLETLEVLR